MSEFYKAAIDILTSEDTDWRGICISVAKINPELFCKASGETPFFVKIRSIYISEGKVAAIKATRAETNMGLKEAKEWVESLIGDN